MVTWIFDMIIRIFVALVAAVFSFLVVSFWVQKAEHALTWQDGLDAGVDFDSFVWGLEAGALCAVIVFVIVLIFQRPSGKNRVTIMTRRD